MHYSGRNNAPTIMLTHTSLFWMHYSSVSKLNPFNRGEVAVFD